VCGIAGFFNVSLDVKKEILQNLEIRGRDGFGFLAWNSPTNKNPGQWIQKSLLPPTDFFSQNGSRFDVTLSSDIIIGNTRAIPTTEFQSGAGSDLRNQQPFTQNRYALVFNGLIANDKELIKKYNLHTDAPVDTAMLIPLFSHVGVIEGMKQLDGSFAIVVFDKIDKKFYFGKNFMPMYYATTKDSALVVSLKEMVPDSIVDQLKEVPPYSCVVYDITDGTHTIESLYRKERNKKAMIICSGGTDSVVTAYTYKRLGYDITLAHFTYGQAAEEVEKFAIEQIAKHLNAKLVVYDARPLFSAFKDASKLLSQKEADPNQQMLDAESTLSYVPNRNAIFAMIIAALAEKENCGTVAFGGQQMDSVYPDNTPDFVRTVDAVLKYSLNWQTNVKFAAPLIHLIKHEIVQLGLNLGVPFDYVCSCYYPKLIDNKIVVCGKCGCCQFRFSSFKMLGFKDTQQYASLPDPKWFDGLKDWDGSLTINVDAFLNKYVRNFA